MARIAIQPLISSKLSTDMYRYEIEVTEMGVTFYETMYANNGREAVEFGRMKYPHAEYVELA